MANTIEKKHTLELNVTYFGLHASVPKLKLEEVASVAFLSRKGQES